MENKNENMVNTNTVVEESPTANEGAQGDEEVKSTPVDTLNTTASTEPVIVEGIATSIADDGSFVLTAQLDEEGEMSNELFQELTSALAGLLDETDGNAQLAINYVIGAVEYKMKLAGCDSIDTFEKTMAESIVLPLAKASDSLPDPNVAISSLMQIDDKSIMEEMGQLAAAGNVPDCVNLEDVDFERIMHYVDDLCRQGIGDENVDAALRDVAHFHEQQRTGNLPELPHVKRGFFKKLKAWRQCMKKQANMLRNLLKQSHNMRDIEIWYSRYLLAAPIELAKDEGFWDAALEAGAKSDAAIRKECAEIAQAMGFDYQPWDVDYDRIHRAMRTFCVNKTGYSHVINWIYAASVRADGKRGSLLA